MSTMAWHAGSTTLKRAMSLRIKAGQLSWQASNFTTKATCSLNSSTANSLLHTRSPPLLNTIAIRYASSKATSEPASPVRTPPSSFATGSKWDIMDHNQKPSGSAEQTSQDAMSGSAQEQALSAAAAMEANLRKLLAIEKVTKRRQAYSPYVLISKLPSTVMPSDIKRMAKSEDDIVTIIYHRNEYMDFLGRATVVFRSATTATEFLTQHFGKFISGHRLGMTMLDPFNNQDKNLIPPQMQPQTFSGQAVLVSGLPLATRPDHLRSEFRKFHLMDTTEHAIVPVRSRKMASTCQYLIRLSSPSEAYRFVRTYHNTYYKKEEYRKRCPMRAMVVY